MDDGLLPIGERGGAIRQASVALILAAAETVFAECGFAGASMARIAALAGLPKANLHYYFGTKERLYRAVLEHILTLWLDAARHWLVPAQHPRQAFAGYIRDKMAYSRDRPQVSRIFAGELLRGAPHVRPFLAHQLRDQVSAISAVIDGWVARGLMRPVAPAHLLFAIWAMTQTYADFAVQIGAVLGHTPLEDADFATATETVIELVSRGCGIIDSKREDAPCLC